METVQSAIEEGREGAVAAEGCIHGETGDFLRPARVEEAKENRGNTDFLLLSMQRGETRQVSNR